MSQRTFGQTVRQLLKKVIKASPLYPAHLDRLKRREIADLMRRGEFSPPPSEEEGRRLVAEWDKEGRPVPPPPAYKHGTVRDYGRRFGLQTLVETGTYMGDTVAACRDQFRHIYSVELSVPLARLAERRFQDDAHVTILQGDSERVLPGILSEVREPCLFWLDGHYSSGITALGKSVTPVLSELAMILAHPVQGHVILVDDAREFRRENNYPALEELRALVAARRPGLSLEVRDDIIRVHRPPVDPPARAAS